MGRSAFLSHSNTCTHPSKPSLSQESSTTCPRLREMENTTGTPLGVPWPQHPPRDFNNEGQDADAWFELVHLLSEWSQDHTMGKFAGLKSKQTCIWILTPRLPVGVCSDLQLSKADFTSVERNVRMTKQKSEAWGQGQNLQSSSGEFLIRENSSRCIFQLILVLTVFTLNSLSHLQRRVTSTPSSTPRKTQGLASTRRRRKKHCFRLVRGLLGRKK